jgi:hypothetical protein
MQAVPPLCPAQCRQPLPASLLHHHVLGPGMRLHQPYRPLQPPEHVHRPRGRCPRFPDHPVLDQRLLGAAYPQLAPPGLEREEVRLSLSCRLVNYFDLQYGFSLL